MKSVSRHLKSFFSLNLASTFGRSFEAPRGTNLLLVFDSVIATQREDLTTAVDFARHLSWRGFSRIGTSDTGTSPAVVHA